ncbi:MAG: hypothetical protein H8F28_15270 [Fibrella sp.]|nr:hypothetical protein [Armatimonadota bacterium]
MTPAQLLASGTATRAIVTHVDAIGASVETQIVTFTYRYELPNGKPETGSVVMPQTRAWQLGLEKGATFTVLYDPKEPTAHKPYFQITDAEIVGAMGAKIAPP